MPVYQRLLALGLIAAGVFVLLRLPEPTIPPVELPVAAAAVPPAREDGRPRLVVMVVFDQVAAIISRNGQPLFVEGGFKRLQTDGAWFANCHYPYTYTLTAPGHASLSTGTYPSKHGIIANDWYDRANNETVSSVTPPPNEKRRGLGPWRRAVKSIGDLLIDTLGLRARVASLSIKDRAAILMAAMRSNVCYWMSGTTGQFVTSRYYREDPHVWVKAFNRGRPADRWLGRDWVRFRKDLDYEPYSGPDDFFAEGIGYDQGQVFPHPTRMGQGEKARERYYSAVDNSPAGNDLLIDFAKTAIVAEKLGQTETVDLLCLSFSSNDLIGHCWGPDSQEVLDITLRSDAMIADFLTFLDARVGKGNYVFAVSADHGVCPLPEFAERQGLPSGRAATRNPHDARRSASQQGVSPRRRKDPLVRSAE